jgi:hypothetical protein
MWKAEGMTFRTKTPLWSNPVRNGEQPNDHAERTRGGREGKLSKTVRKAKNPTPSNIVKHG